MLGFIRARIRVHPFSEPSRVHLQLPIRPVRLYMVEGYAPFAHHEFVESAFVVLVWLATSFFFAG